MTGIRASIAVGIAWAVGWGAAVPRAGAYPQWQLRDGASRCNQCHVAPAGGGLLSRDGRRAVGEQLSSFSGEGAWLHGAAALPGWLALGADLRGGYVTTRALQHDSTAAAPAAFPAEVQAKALLSWRTLALYGSLAARGQLPGDDSVVPLQNYQPLPTAWLVSREHWLMWRPGEAGLYLRAGRFFAPFGLRLPERNAFVVRDLGFDELQESYNLSAGVVRDAWEAHLTAFAPDVVRHFGSEETGAAGYFERRFQTGAGPGAWGLQARYAKRPGATRTIGGAVGKYYLAPLRTLFLAEADGVLLAVPGLRARGQAIGALEATVFPVKGLRISALGEHLREDLQVRGAARSATSLLIGWLPYAHLEGQVMARVEFPAGGDTTTLLFAQLHYFL